MEMQQVIEGSFSAIRGYQDGLLVFRQDDADFSTTIQRVDLAGEVQKETVFPERCFLYSIHGEKIVVNCETGSFMLDPNLNATSFSDPVFLLSQAPDGSAWVLVTRSEETYLMDSALTDRALLSLDGVPLEARWLPDSSGFLYRVPGKLSLYDIGNGTSRLLVESDLFSDYTNINAAWINLK